MLDKIIEGYHKGMYTAMEFSSRCLKMVDVKNPGEVLEKLDNELWARVWKYTMYWVPKQMLANYDKSYMPSDEQVAAATKWFEAKNYLVKGFVLIQSDNEWLITDIISEDEIEITPIKMSPHMSTYLSEGVKYRVKKHEGSKCGEDLRGVWEIDGEDMDRDSSQVLFYEWREGPGIEIDS